MFFAPRKGGVRGTLGSLSRFPDLIRRRNMDYH
jgi:hypothetical protein